MTARGFHPARKAGDTPAARGFHPAMHARRYADGGLVGGIKRAFGFDPERAAMIAEYKAQQKAEAAKAAASAPAPAEKPAGRGMVQNAAGALRNRRKQIDEAAGYKNGGMVRGPGTGTSDDIEAVVPEGSYIMPADTTAALGPEALASMGRGFPGYSQATPGPDQLASMGQARGLPGYKQPDLGKPVPVNLSNGEYQMPPEQVHAVGVQALDQIKDATHTPTAMAAARGFPVSDDGARLFFADGGVVDDDERRRRASSFGDEAAATTDPRTRVVNTPADSGLEGVPAINGTQRDTGPAPQVHSPMEVQPARGFPSPDQPRDQSPKVRGGFGFQTQDGSFQTADSATMAANLRDGVGVQRGVGGSGPSMQVLGGGYGLRDPEYLAQRNAMVGASSMTNARDRNPKTGMSPAETALAGIYADRKHASDRAMQEMRAGADLQRTAMQEQGALQRQAMGDATKMAQAHAQGVSDQAGRNLDERKFALESRVKGVEMGGAQRQQQLLDMATNPRATPDQRAMALHALQIMRGGAQRAGQGAQLPTAALKMQQEELDALGISSSIDADLGAINQQLDSGQLTLGPFRNLWNRGRNAIGASTDESRNLATFDATLEKLRNDSLRLNKGVQTEGDAQRAWNEVLKNTSDPELVRQRLAEVQRINQRAAELRAANVDQVRQNFGADPLDTSPYRNVAPAVGQQGQATAAQADDWGQQWQEMPSGTLYTAPDGSIRRKK
mgnify:CR=1 FL=1